jgi:hypothetical protein
MQLDSIIGRLGAGFVGMLPEMNEVRAGIIGLEEGAEETSLARFKWDKAKRACSLTIWKVMRGITANGADTPRLAKPL